MNTLVRATMCRFIYCRLEPNGTAGMFLAVSGGPADRRLFIHTVMTIGILGILAGCTMVASPESRIPAVSVESLEYYSGEVKGYQNSYPEDHVLVLAPVDHRNLPVSNDAGDNDLTVPGGSAEIGVIYDQDSDILQRIYTQPIEPIVQSALAKSAKEAGLVPAVSDKALESALRRRAEDYVLASQITKCWLERRTIDDPYNQKAISVTAAVFELKVQVYKPPFHVAFWQGNRAVDYSDPSLVYGAPDPAGPVSLYEHPGQVLSVALSRAVAGIFANDSLRQLIMEDSRTNQRHLGRL